MEDTGYEAYVRLIEIEECKFTPPDFSYTDGDISKEEVILKARSIYKKFHAIDNQYTKNDALERALEEIKCDYFLTTDEWNMLEDQI